MNDPQTDSIRSIAREAFEAWQRGDAPIIEIFAPQMVWRIEGSSAMAREYGNAQEFIDEVLAPFGARFAEGEPFRPVKIRSVLADGDTAVVLWDGRGVANDGVPYENSYAWFMRFEDGKVVDGTAFFDGIALNELWGRVDPA